ncbi:MAG: response regulator [Chloroflexaceae bacterium]|nr:response regulator [Chloroflexaceae bacterium]
MSGHTLIIEPDQALAQRFETILNDEGFDIEIVASGNEGMRAARRHPPDVIVLDANLLHTEDEVARNYWAFKLHPRTRHVPIVVLTEQQYERAVGEADPGRVGDYSLPKNTFIPFTLFELLRFIHLA